MIPFDPPEKLTAEEEQFLRDNKSAHWMGVVKKCIKAVHDNLSYLEHADGDKGEEKLMFRAGQKNGAVQVFNFLNFYSQDKVKQPEERKKIEPR